jgi:tetratricopeptide (TPR) repeat protein
MNQTASPASRGLTKNAVVFGLIIALGIGFAAGWLVRDARESGGRDQAGAGPESAAMAAQIDQLKAQTAADPRNAGAWEHLGHLYFDSGQPGPAVAAYAKYLELSPGDPDVLTDMGVMYRELGQSDRALECFDAAIAANPRHEIAHFNKGIVLLTDKGDTAGALAAFTALLRINPNAKAPDGRPVAELVEKIRPQAGSKPGMLIGK